ncbi:MAG: YggT family protein [Chloroflexi bacterium]|nr:YggT family protein [Chloroflexota bacterium]
MFIQFLVAFVQALFTVLFWAIIGRALLSWFRISPSNPFFPLKAILDQITDPILGPLRRVVPTIGMIDITPIVALLLLQFAQALLITALNNVARGF